jgi:xanthosine utilization system XapX-like protein
MDSLKWIVGGGVVFLLIYLLTPSDNLWPALFFSLFAGLAITAIYYFMTVKSREIPVVATTLLIVLFISAFVVSYTLYERSQFQSELLTEIRSTIEVGIMTSELSTISLEVMKHEGSFTEAIKELYGEDTESGVEIRPFDDGTFRVVVTEIGEDVVVLSAISDWVRGRDADFQNLDGESGKVQTMITINQAGAFYERQN